MRLSMLAATAAAIGLLGCAADATAPATPDLGLFLARSVNEFTPFGPVDITACSGEAVTVAGISHVAAAERQSKAGTVATLRLTSRGEGVGTESGARYLFHDSFTLDVRPNAAGGDSMTDVQTIRLIGQGQVPDRIFRVRYRLRINGAGVQTETVQVTDRCN